MDIDDPPLQQQPQYALQPTNALAGPSTFAEPSSHPQLFLPPPAPPRQRPYFTSTDDLISRFNLLPAYDRYVRPFINPQQGGAQVPTTGPADKGKGKEVPPKDVSTPSAVPIVGGGHDGEDEEGGGKGEKKWRNNYKHLIKGIPGKHSMKKDDYLMTLMQVPPKQRNNIIPFDLRTQREAFSVNPDGLKGWNNSVLVAESPQAREDRKRRKELKKLAKAGQLPPSALSQAVSSSNTQPATPIGVPASTPGGPGHPPVRSNTPRPGTSTTHRPSPISHQSQPPGRVPNGLNTPHVVSTPVSSAGPPHQVTTPAATPHAISDGTGVKRGVKREREDSVSGTNGGGLNGNAHHGVQIPMSATPVNGTARPQIVVNAKAGNAGIRPRPIKKARMDTQGNFPVQQPTPHA
ncbi:Mediator of RNA polymerase II transcription subunit 19 [Abortiporus biennis]